MNVKTLSLVLAGVMTLSATAQDMNLDYVKSHAAKEIAFKPESKWFLGLYGGVQYGFGVSQSGPLAGASKFDYVGRLGESAGIALGRWHNPYFGTRLMIDWNRISNPYAPQISEGKLQKAHSLNPHLDVMFDVVNYLSTYDAERTFHLVPFLGVGYMATQKLFATEMLNEQNIKDMNFIHSVSVNMGVNFDFRVCPCVTFNLAPSLAIGNFFEGYTQKDEPMEFLPQLRAGLTFGLCNDPFTAVEPMDYELLNNMQSEINDLRAQNAELSKRPVSCPECPEVEPATIVNELVESIVYFRIGSSTIEKNQYISIFNVAEFVKANKSPITVIGYADAKTGKSAYNMTLSEKRARNVANILVEKYGVPSELITIDYKGDTVQPYQTNAWNRVVIMKSKK